MTDPTVPAPGDLRDRIARWRGISALDERAGAPVGEALRQACAELERLSLAVRDVEEQRDELNERKLQAYGERDEARRELESAWDQLHADQHSAMDQAQRAEQAEAERDQLLRSLMRRNTELIAERDALQREVADRGDALADWQRVAGEHQRALFETRAERDALQAAIDAATQADRAHIAEAHPDRMRVADCAGCRIGLPLSRERPTRPDDRAEIERRRELLRDLTQDAVETGTYGDPAPETHPAPGKRVINVPDRIDYDSDGELDDVVVTNCDAHLERMDTGRWYLGLYGTGGRKVQIDIASRTGRAEVTGLVRYSEGIAPETPGDADHG